MTTTGTTGTRPAGPRRPHRPPGPTARCSPPVSAPLTTPTRPEPKLARREAELSPGQAAAAGAQFVGDLPQRERGRRIGLAEHERDPGVTAFAQPDVDRHLPEQRHLRPGDPAERGRDRG